MQVPKGPGPAVSQNQRDWIRPFAGLMDKVNWNFINRDFVMRKGVDLLLVYAPVIPVNPVVHKFAEIFPVGAVGPIPVGKIHRPMRPGQAVMQVLQHLVRNCDPEGILAHVLLLSPPRRAGFLPDRRLTKRFYHPSTSRPSANCSAPAPRACTRFRFRQRPERSWLTSNLITAAPVFSGAPLWVHNSPARPDRRSIGPG